MLMAPVAGGHVLLEGARGLPRRAPSGRSRRVVDANYSRMQFTPDVLPAVLADEMENGSAGSPAGYRPPRWAALNARGR